MKPEITMESLQGFSWVCPRCESKLTSLSVKQLKNNIRYHAQWCKPRRGKNEGKKHGG